MENQALDFLVEKIKNLIVFKIVNIIFCKCLKFLSHLIRLQKNFKSVGTLNTKLCVSKNP